MNEREIVIKSVCNAINDVINCIISENEQMSEHSKEKEVYTVLEVFCKVIRYSQTQMYLKALTKRKNIFNLPLIIQEAILRNIRQ